MKRALKIIVIIAIAVYFFTDVLINLIGVPLAAYHSYEAWQDAGEIVHEDFHPKDSDNQLYFTNGVWVHDGDSLSGIEIKNDKWIMFYNRMKTDSSDIYDYQITDGNSIFADSQPNTGEFLKLTNSLDTLYYEILGYNKEFLSLMNLPKGNIHIYKAKK